MRRSCYTALIAIGFCLIACGSEKASTSYGLPTEQTCPEASELTYDNFGAPFMQKYCTECHGSTKQGRERQGAPSDHDFDTLKAIRTVGYLHIDASSAASDTQVNTAMPPATYSPQPTLAERKQLGEWLACGMP